MQSIYLIQIAPFAAYGCRRPARTCDPLDLIFKSRIQPRLRRARRLEVTSSGTCWPGRTVRFIRNCRVARENRNTPPLPVTCSGNEFAAIHFRQKVATVPNDRLGSPAADAGRSSHIGPLSAHTRSTGSRQFNSANRARAITPPVGVRRQGLGPHFGRCCASTRALGYVR